MPAAIVIVLLFSLLLILSGVGGCGGRSFSNADVDKPSNVLSLAVVRAGLDDAEHFRRIMAEALRAVCRRDGIDGAIHFRSVDDAAVYGDLVWWRSRESAQGAAEWASGSAVCQAYFAATAEDRLFGHVTSACGAPPLELDHATSAQFLYIAHLVPVRSDCETVAAMDDAAQRLRRSAGCIAASWGRLEGDAMGGMVLIAVWAEQGPARSAAAALLLDAPWVAVAATHDVGLYQVIDQFAPTSASIAEAAR